MLADDQEIPRQTFRGLLDRAEGLLIAGEAADGASAVRLARELEPEVVYQPWSNLKTGMREL